MHRKKFLMGACSILGVIGILGVATPFISSMKPNARSLAALPRLDVSNIEAGTFQITSHPAYGELYNGFSWSVLIFKNSSGQFYLWDIPTKNGAVGMPDIYWWRPFYECKSFGPTVVNGLVDETKPIKCHDTDIEYEWWIDEWQWDINGNKLGKNVKNMEETKGVVEGKYFVFQKNS